MTDIRRNVGTVRRLLRLPAADRRLLLAAFAVVVVVRMGLWILPFRSVRGLVARMGRRTHRRTSSPGAERIAWAVRTSARAVPGASCLTQALTAKALLSREGMPGDLRIGVAKDGGTLQAHAWVESGGRVLIGDHDLERFTVLPPMDGELS